MALTKSVVKIGIPQKAEHLITGSSYRKAMLICTLLLFEQRKKGLVESWQTKDKDEQWLSAYPLIIYFVSIKDT